MRAWWDGKWSSSQALQRQPRIDRASQDLKFYKGTTHNDIHYHFVRKKVAEGQMILEYCWVKDMKADLMTKSTIFI